MLYAEPFFGDKFTQIIVCQIILNLIYTFSFLKLKIWLNILTSVIISCLSLFLSITLVDFGLHPKASDSYGIATAILYNGLFPIIFWEIAFQINKYFNDR